MKKSLVGASLLTLSCLYFLLAAIIILITIFTGIPVIYGLVTSMIIIIIQFLISPFLTDLTMKLFYRAKFNYELPENIKQFITTVCNDNSMKYPKIGFIDDGAPNAFTYGHTKNDARVVITRGILELLDEEEVKAVIAHELGHACHYDMLVMTVAQLVPLFLYSIYEIFIKRDSDSSNNKGSNVYTLAIGLIAYVLYIISNYIVLYLSRTREYYADNFSIDVTKNPNALASALVKVGFGLSTSPTNAKHSAAKSNSLGIFDSKASKALAVSSYENGTLVKDDIKQAMKWEQWNIWAKWYEFNSTHPLISKRLLTISKRSSEFNQEPFIVFDLQKTESYVDDFAIELIINFLPMIILILGILIVFIGNICEVDGPILSKVEALTVLGISIAYFIRFKRRYKSGEFTPTNVKSLLGEIKVSNITAIPCELEGYIIGRGNPGCIFNEDFVIKDETGIIFLDYNQPIHIINKIFALFKSPEYFDKKVKVQGWYRRSPVPYVELKTIEIDGKVKKVYTYGTKLVLFSLLGIAGLIIFLASLI